MSAQDDAKTLVDAFAAAPTCPSVWPHLDRADIAAGLKVRIDDPDRINQASTSLCGPADFARDVAEDQPVVYAKAVIDLFKTGAALIGTFAIKPGSDLKKYSILGSVAPVDWILLASIRDTDNWFLDYQSESDDVAAITMPHSKVNWLKNAGYTDIVSDTNILASKKKACAARASDLYNQGYKVALFINANMLYAAKMFSSSLTPDHWVALTSNIEFDSETVELEVYSWGKGHRKVPESGVLPESKFLNNYYGFVACRR
jgi:hypothetical protein